MDPNVSIFSGNARNFSWPKQILQIPRNGLIPFVFRLRPLEFDVVGRGPNFLFVLYYFEMSFSTVFGHYLHYFSSIFKLFDSNLINDKYS